LPTFFDLDRYFALWRCRALFHLYFDKEENRAYIVFDRQKKKMLYLLGKKTYNYSKPQSLFPPARFNNEYVVSEEEYRAKKAKAFSRRKVSDRATKWIEQRNALIRVLYNKFKMSEKEMEKLFKELGFSTLSQPVISKIVNKIVIFEEDEPETLEIEGISIQK